MNGCALDAHEWVAVLARWGQVQADCDGGGTQLRHGAAWFLSSEPPMPPMTSVPFSEKSLAFPLIHKALNQAQVPGSRFGSYSRSFQAQKKGE